MNSKEVRNELLAEIHNRLAEISKFLEVGIAMLAKLDDFDIELLKSECEQLHITEIRGVYDILQEEDCDVGRNSDKGLYRKIWDKEAEMKISSPLGTRYKRTCPVGDDGCFLAYNEIEARKKHEAE